MLGCRTETICMVRKRKASFVKGRTTPYSRRKRSISLLHPAISCVIELYARAKLRRPCIFINLREVPWRRLNKLCDWIPTMTGGRKHTVLRPFSARLPPHPAAGVPAIRTLTIDELARLGRQYLPCFAWLSGMQSEGIPRNRASGRTSTI